jgi:hypothetical protein
VSSTKRSQKRYEHDQDYYVTPIDEIVKFLQEFQKHEPTVLQGKILDPCAGGDSTHEMSYPKALQQVGAIHIDTIDIRENSLAKVKGNFLELDAKGYDLIITNPPFAVAQPIILKALEEVNLGGFVVMLLRLNYFGGKARFGFWKDNMPKYTFVHSRRMSFTDDKKTDSIEYMHVVWQKGLYPEFTQLKVVA